jgi:hypothetical protein
MKKRKAIPVVVTDAHRAVFFGYAVPPFGQKSMRIEKARMCVYWSSDVRSLSGLIGNGPSANCRIGPQIPYITITEVVSVSEVSEQSAEKFEAAPWKI